MLVLEHLERAVRQLHAGHKGHVNIGVARDSQKFKANITLLPLGYGEVDAVVL